MSNTESKKLTVDVIARIDKLEKSMAKASKATNTASDKMAARTKRLGGQIEKNLAGAADGASVAFKAVFAGIAGGIAGVGLGALVSGAREAAASLANIGSEAERAGVSAKVFQELSYVAQQNRIPIDALTDGLKELALRSDELIQTGTGPAAESFHRLGISAADLKEKLKDPQALMIEIIEKLGQLDKASQIRISDELFGGSAGERFVELVDSGADGIRTLIAEANSFGLVVDDSMIAKAAELDRQFSLVANTVGTALKQAIVSAATALTGFMDQFNEVQKQQDVTIRRTLETVYSDRTATQGRLEDAKKAQSEAFLGNLYQPEIDMLSAQLEKQTAEALRLRDILDKRQGFSPDFVYKPPAEPASTLNPAPFKPSSGGGGGAPKREARDAAAEKAKRETEAVAELIAELEREKGLIGATDVQRQISNALRQAGAEATEEQKARIVELVSAIDSQTKATERAADAQAALKDTARDALMTIADGIRSGAEAGEIFGDVLNQLADKLISMAINNLVSNAFGGGGGGGILSSILGAFTGGGGDPWSGLRVAGARAAGGPVAAGKRYLVGEKGPELFSPGSSGTIIPNSGLSMSAPGMGGRASSPNITIGGASIVIQGDANADTIKRMQAMLKDYDKGTVARVVAANREARKRSMQR